MSLDLGSLQLQNCRQLTDIPFFPHMNLPGNSILICFALLKTFLSFPLCRPVSFLFCSPRISPSLIFIQSHLLLSITFSEHDFFQISSTRFTALRYDGEARSSSLSRIQCFVQTFFFPQTTPSTCQTKSKEFSFQEELDTLDLT